MYSNKPILLKSKRVRGYTLIEMLITITIFSGLLIIVLGSFASSSSSSAKVGTLREKNQAARAIIDQLTNDLRYVDTSAEFTEDTDRYKGYLTKPLRNRLVLALRLPNADPNRPFVRKDYTIKIVDGRLTLTLLEKRKCLINNFIWDCDSNSQSVETDLLSTVYALNQDSRFPSEFGGITVRAAEDEDPPISPYVAIDLTLKPSSLTLNCNDPDVDAGTCYKVSTKINMGVSR